MRFTECVRGTLTLADGAWGTQLIQRGGKLTDCLNVWNLTKPDLVRGVADSYIRAGSRVILTNTFRANPLSLASYGLENQCDAINRAGVRISRQAAGESALVFASIGPVSQPRSAGEIAPKQLESAFSKQAQALASEQPDAILIETMLNLEQARVAATAALGTGLPVLVSFVFLPEEKLHGAARGVTPEQFANALGGEGVHALGTNCIDILDSIAICKRLSSASALPIWIKPNAGLPDLAHGASRYPTSPEEFAGAAPELQKAGATFLGGCCGTTPEYIRALALRLASQSGVANLPIPL